MPGLVEYEVNMAQEVAGVWVLCAADAVYCAEDKECDFEVFYGVVLGK
jgi:hypothetical protein